MVTLSEPQALACGPSPIKGSVGFIAAMGLVILQSGFDSRGERLFQIKSGQLLVNH